MLLIAIALTAAAVSADNKEESLRAQLASLQKETGLSLTYFGWYVGILDFTHRNKVLAAQHLPAPAGNAQNGDVSPHGTMVAFAWVYSTNRFASRLGIVHTNGVGVREFPFIKAPKYFCWSPDESKLAVYTYLHDATSKKGSLVVLDLESNQVEEIATGPAFLTPQCWSPDNSSLVYGISELGDESMATGRVAMYSFHNKTTKILATGAYATWLSNGDQIAFLDGEDYYVIRSSGDEKKLVLHVRKPRTGLLWSPDGRFVAYGVCCKYDRSTTLWRFYVRRLNDNAEVWVADVGDIPHGRDVHWVKQ